MPAPSSRKRSADAQAIAAAPCLRDALLADFQRHGAAAVAQLRETDPIAYLRLCGELLDAKPSMGGDDAALIARVQALLAQVGALSEPADG